MSLESICREGHHLGRPAARRGHRAGGLLPQSSVTPRGLARLASTLFIGLMTACASTPPQAPALSSLEVENRTPDELRVSVRGRFEGVVEPGTRLRVRNLAPGPAALEAAGTGEGAAVHRLAGTLEAGKNTLWPLMPDLDREPLAEVPPLTSLRIENPEKVDLEAAVYTPNGRLAARGRVFAGQSRRFEDLPSGPVTIEVRQGLAGATTRVELVLSVGDAMSPDGTAGETAWRFESQGARLVIENATDEALEVAVDGLARGRVAAGGRLELLEGAGTRVISARSVPSLRPYETVLALNRGEEALWEVRSGRASLRVDNQAGESLMVWTRARGAEFAEQGSPLEPGARLTVDELEPGIHEVSAIGQRSKLRYGGVVEVGANQAGTFVVGPIHGTIRVDNRTSGALWLYVSELGWPERKFGVVPKDTVVLLKNLARGPVSLRAIRPPSTLGRELLAADSGAEALDLVSTRVFTSRQDLAETPAATWVIGERVGSVRVDNQRDEVIEVFADGARLGEVPAKGARVFSGVPAGARRIDTVGRASRETYGESLALGEDAVVTVTVVPTTGWLVVENGTSETLTPRGQLAVQAERIEPGQSFRFRVRSGEIGAALTGAETGYRYGKVLVVPPGGETTWVAQVAPGSLVLWSQLAESVAVTLGDLAQGTLAPDESLALPNLAPGPYRVQTVGLRSGRVRAYDLFISPESQKKLTLTVELGVVLVENLAKEPVEVSIDGEPYGRVEAGRVHAFGRVPPGAREVLLDFAKSARTQKVAVELREGQRIRVTAHPPVGLLVIENNSGEPLKVYGENQLLASLPADSGTTFVHAPAGPQLVRIERMDSRTELGIMLDVFADQAIHLPVPGRQVRLVVVNRTDEVLELFADDAALLTLPARSSQMLEKAGDALGRGEVRLVARHSRGQIPHEERRRLRAGETATWVLD